jgi:hypothetical protein
LIPGLERSANSSSEEKSVNTKKNEKKLEFLLDHTSTPLFFSACQLACAFLFFSLLHPFKMADDAAAPAAAAAADDGAKRRTFRRFSYRGVDLEQLLELKTEEMVQLFGARQRRRYVSF